MCVTTYRNCTMNQTIIKKVVGLLFYIGSDGEQLTSVLFPIRNVEAKMSRQFFLDSDGELVGFVVKMTQLVGGEALRTIALPKGVGDDVDRGFAYVTFAPFAPQHLVSFFARSFLRSNNRRRCFALVTPTPCGFFALGRLRATRRKSSLQVRHRCCFGQGFLLVGFFTSW